MKVMKTRNKSAANSKLSSFSDTCRDWSSIGSRGVIVGSTACCCCSQWFKSDKRQASHFRSRGLAATCQERHADEPSNEEQEQLFLVRELLPGAVRERLQREVTAKRKWRVVEIQLL